MSLVLLSLLLCVPFVARSGPRFALMLDVTGAIGPATSDYVHRGLERAREDQAAVVILRINTPGGLDSAMRAIIQDILASPVPVVAYVAPSGARAASAGTYILYASHVAVMAPGTNVGAATPVQIGGLPVPGGGGEKNGKNGRKGGAAESGSPLEHKIVNDARAYIRALAQLRGRNALWAEQAVTQASSLSAEEALKARVIDVIAPDVPSLLAQVNGRKVSVRGRDEILHTAGLEVRVIEPDWRNRLLAVITDPNVAYILMLVGIYGLIFELASPGYVLPGVTGAICLLLALYAFQVLSVNYAGLALVLLGITFMVAEVFVSSFGALGVGGIIAFVIGSIILFDTGPAGYAISLPLVGTVALLSAVFLIGVIGMAIKARLRPVVSGREHMIGEIGETLDDFDQRGRVRVHSEIWWARTQVALKRGQKVRVTGMEGLTLNVEPLSEEQ